MTKALTDGQQGEQPLSDFAQFEQRWARSEELCDVLRRLPSRLVLRSGMAGQRQKLLERWDALEIPGLDDETPSSGVQTALQKWIEDAKTLIRYIVQLGDAQAESTARSLNEGEPELYYDVIEDLCEAEGVSDQWCWPWEIKALSTRPKSRVDVDKMIKYGALTAGALILVQAWMEED